MNVMKKIALENLGIDKENNESWKIENDGQADWALDMIREHQAEYKRFEMVVNDKIQQLQETLKEEREKTENETNFFKTKLAEYFELVPKKKTKTQETYKLPSGRLVKKYKKPKFKRNDAELVKWLKKNNMPELVKIKESADWATLKKETQIAGERVISKHTGEVIEGVTVVEQNPEFRVEV